MLNNPISEYPEQRERAIPIRGIRMALFTCPKCLRVLRQPRSVGENINLLDGSHNAGGFDEIIHLEGFEDDHRMSAAKLARDPCKAKPPRETGGALPGASPPAVRPIRIPPHRSAPRGAPSGTGRATCPRPQSICDVFCRPEPLDPSQMPPKGAGNLPPEEKSPTRSLSSMGVFSAFFFA